LVTGFIVFMIVSVLGGCATLTTQAPPPMEKRQGEAPTAAMLPIGNTNDPAVAGYVTQYLGACLQDRNVLDFVSREEVDQAVSESGYDMGKTFGLSASEYKGLAQALGVDYVMHGVVTVRKNLTLAGWRKDVDVYVKLYDGRTGESVEGWRSMTDFTFTDLNTATDARKMGESAANHICSKILKSGF
jgi:uncharacterized protein YceK